MHTIIQLEYTTKLYNFEYFVLLMPSINCCDIYPANYQIGEADHLS